MNKRILGVLFLTLLVVMLGFSILFPIEAFYIKSFNATSLSMGALIMLYSLMQFIFSPFWGRLSDRIGRKPVLLIGLCGYALSMVAMGMATELWHLFAARGFGGILSSATLPTAMAVIADSTDEEHRTRGMGILGAAFGLGVIIGPAVGGLLGRNHLWLPYFVTAGLAAAIMVFVLVALPESLPPARRGAHAGRRKSRWAAFHRAISALYFISFIVSFTLAGLEATFGFLAADRYGLGPDKVGLMFVVMGLASAGIQGGAIGPLQRRFGDTRLIQAGLVVSAIGFTAIALAATPLLATIAIAVFAAGNGLIRPANVSLISKRAQVGHGLAIGLLDSFDSMGRIAGPLVGGLLYRFYDYLPYALGAVLTLASGLLFALLYTAPAPEPRADPAP